MGMFRALLLCTTLLGGCSAMATEGNRGLLVPQIDTTNCEPAANLPRMLAQWDAKFKERVIWFGPSYDGTVTGYLFVSPTGGWTMMVATATAVCVVTMGESSEFVRPTFLMPGGSHART